MIWINIKGIFYQAIKRKVIKKSKCFLMYYDMIFKNNDFYNQKVFISNIICNKSFMLTSLRSHFKEVLS